MRRTTALLPLARRNYSPSRASRRRGAGRCGGQTADAKDPVAPGRSKKSWVTAKTSRGFREAFEKKANENRESSWKSRANSQKRGGHAKAKTAVAQAAARVRQGPCPDQTIRLILSRLPCLFECFTAIVVSISP